MTSKKVDKSKKLDITCGYQKTMPLSDLVEFQGGLKTTTQEKIAKAKASLLKHGFSFPVFVWKTSIIDGHQRLKAVAELIAEGWTLEAVPVVEIEAKSRKEAAEKLLVLNSRYAEITPDGIAGFVQDFEIEIGDLADLVEIPEIDFGNFGGGGDFEPGTEDEQGRLDELKPKTVRCPECGKEFDSRGREC